MKIYNTNQYNQGISKYKLLSSTSGVGSIVTTKFGNYVLIKDINNWKFISLANKKVGEIRNIKTDGSVIYNESKRELSNSGLEIIDDLRFIKFLKKEKQLENLVCLLKIPHMTLNERFNSPNWKNHPLKKKIDNANFEDYMIPAVHFPSWFRGDKGALKEIKEWYSLWKEECRRHGNNLRLDNFAPPRDATKFIREFQAKNEDGSPITLRDYEVLEQLNLVLICENGHLSDIPWSKYLRWRSLNDNNAENLLSPNANFCCQNPKLKWTESNTKSEGYSSIYIECENCRLGSGDENKPKINLEGINSIEPYCQGHKPWECINKLDATIPRESCNNSINLNLPTKMKVRLVTANNVYFANCFSSLFIPTSLIENKSQNLLDAIEIVNERFTVINSRRTITKAEYWNSKIATRFEEYIEENNIIIDGDINTFKNELNNSFLELLAEDDFDDSHEHYRQQEFKCFISNSDIDLINLKFRDIQLNNQLSEFFNKIQKVEELKETKVQLDFTRVTPKQRVVRRLENGRSEIIESSQGQNIFSIEPKQLFVLPANEILGEGLFFQFKDEMIQNWITSKSSTLNARFDQITREPSDDNQQGASNKRKLFLNGFKHFLVHSFSHMIMRELEFSCGYPTASLKERLYISNGQNNQMSGVLIYTSEGSEGSMGGLVSQGEPEKILEILRKGLQRSTECSSDPLCWESDGQGIFDLNLAACFSCSLVAETACEDMNLGLDRRVLIDEDFGYFKSLI